MDYFAIPGFLQLFYVSLFVFGLLFGSFSSVLIWRWKNGENGILMGRSHCPKCNHTLTASELIPVFSYIFQRGKCKNCHTKISAIYPILEISMGIIFVLMGFASIEVFGNNIFSPAFFFLIFFGFISVIYTFYDILFTEIPDQIYLLFWLFIGIIAIFLIQNSPENIFYDFKILRFSSIEQYFSDKIFAIFLLYSFLFLQILIPASLYFLGQKKYKKIGEIFILYFIFPFIPFYDFVKKFFVKKSEIPEQDEEEIPIWIGPGDLFIAIIIGFTLGTIGGIIAFFVAYIVGSLYGIFAIIFGKNDRKSMIAFGPFLAI